MNTRPILMSAPMIRALLDGRKTQTRRVVKPQPANPETFGISPIWGHGCKGGRFYIHAATNVNGLRKDRNIGCPHGQPGDHLWVRETWGHDWFDDGQSRAWKRFVYRADAGAQPSDNGTPLPWRPSIFMPRAASRITLEITDVRCERLTDISEADAKAEGVTLDDTPANHREHYRCLWNEINAARGNSWATAPWVWAITFRVV